MIESKWLYAACHLFVCDCVCGMCVCVSPICAYTHLREIKKSISPGSNNPLLLHHLLLLPFLLPSQHSCFYLFSPFNRSHLSSMVFVCVCVCLHALKLTNLTVCHCKPQSACVCVCVWEWICCVGVLVCVFSSFPWKMPPPPQPPLQHPSCS